MQTYVYFNIIYNNQDIKATSAYVKRWMEKEVVHIYNAMSQL